MLPRYCKQQSLVSDIVFIDEKFYCTCRFYDLRALLLHSKNFDGFIPAEPVANCVDVESQMLEAAKAGDSEQVQRLLTAYPQIVNCRDLDGR